MIDLCHPLSLREEARKSWDYFISDEIMYAAEARDGGHSKRLLFWLRFPVQGSQKFGVSFCLPHAVENSFGGFS